MARPAAQVDVVDRFLTALRDVSKCRAERPNWDKAAGDYAWVAYEREQMRALINEIRAERGRGPVDAEEVRRVERLAVGHIDYASKYALYCAQLAQMP